MFIFSGVSQDRDRRDALYATLFNNLTLQILIYIRRWLRVPQWSQTDLDINLALPLIDSVTLGKFLEIFLILLLILKKW